MAATAREAEVLALIGEHLTNAEIGTTTSCGRSARPSTTSEAPTKRSGPEPSQTIGLPDPKHLLRR
jgi:hypothetical protein